MKRYAIIGHDGVRTPVFPDDYRGRDGVSHPANIVDSWSEDELHDQLGFVPVTVDPVPEGRVLLGWNTEVAADQRSVSETPILDPLPPPPPKPVPPKQLTPQEARDEAKRKIDAACGEARKALYTDVPGQLGVYNSKRREADLWLRLKPGTLDPDRFPFLASAVGSEGDTPDAVATLWQSRARAQDKAFAAIEKRRLDAKKRVDAAQTLTEVDAVVSDITQE